LSKSISTINIGDVFQVWLDKTNLIINTLATEIVTANNNANGAVTSGNAYMSGILFANTLTTSGLRGGNVQSAANLAILSNTAVTGFISATTQLTIGGNLVINTGTFTLGNSTVNTLANSSVISTGTFKAATVNATTGTITILNSNTIAANSVTIGNVSITTNLIEIGNSTVNVQINTTSLTVQNSSGVFEAAIGDSVSNTFFNDKFRFSNATTTGTTAQTVDNYAMDTFRGVEYLFSCRDNSSNNSMITKLLCTHNDVNAFMTEYGEIYSSSDLGSFNAVTNATHVLIQFTPTVANCTINMARTHLGA